MVCPFFVGFCLVYVLQVEQYPNEEIRAVVWKACTKPFSYSETHETHSENGTSVLPEQLFPPETAGCSLLDIGSKSETDEQTGVPVRSPGWGLLPREREFSRYGRRKLARAGGVFDKGRMKSKEILFLTGTLPGSTDEAFRGIAEWSGFIVHSLKAWINKLVPGKCDFYVWEHQKRGALHLHYAVWCPDRVIGERIRESFPVYWLNLLRRVSGLSGRDLFDKGNGSSWLPSGCVAGQYAQWVVKDVSAYLSKYVTKGGRGRRLPGSVVFYSPSQWYGVSRPLQQALREMSVKLIFDFGRKREAESKFYEIYAWLCNIADVCHIYKCDVSGLPACVSYKSHWSINVICQNVNLAEALTMPQSKKSLKCSEWTTSYLRLLMRRYSMTPYHLSKNSSQTAVVAAEKLSACVSNSILEAMELSHAMRWTLWSKFRDRGKPSSYEKDMSLLDELYHKLLTRKLQKNLTGCEDLSHLDDLTVDNPTV